MYSNVLDKNHTSGILIRPISDHQMYFCIMNENFRKCASQKKFIELEVFNDESIEKIQNEIANLEMHNQLDANINKKHMTITKLCQHCCRLQKINTFLNVL